MNAKSEVTYRRYMYKLFNRILMASFWSLGFVLLYYEFAHLLKNISKSEIQYLS